MKLKDACSLEHKLWPNRYHIKKQRHYFANKGPSSQGYGFSSGHVRTWSLDHKTSWAQKNWYFWTVVLEKTLKSPLDWKEIQPVHPKGNQSLIFIQRTDAEAETPIFWPPDAKNQLTGKDPDAGKDLRQEEKGMTRDEIVGWHHRLYGHEFEEVPGTGDGQGSLVCCSPWDLKELDTSEWLNWTVVNLKWMAKITCMYILLKELPISRNVIQVVWSIRLYWKIRTVNYTVIFLYCLTSEFMSRNKYHSCFVCWNDKFAIHLAEIPLVNL